MEEKQEKVLPQSSGAKRATKPQPISELIVTQEVVRDVAALEKMAAYVRGGGIFSVDAMLSHIVAEHKRVNTHPSTTQEEVEDEGEDGEDDASGESSKQIKGKGRGRGRAKPAPKKGGKKKGKAPKVSHSNKKMQKPKLVILAKFPDVPSLSSPPNLLPTSSTHSFLSQNHQNIRTGYIYGMVITG